MDNRRWMVRIIKIISWGSRYYRRSTACLDCALVVYSWFS